MDEFGSVSRDSRYKQRRFNDLVTHSLDNQKLINDRFQTQLEQMRKTENERYEILSQANQQLNRTVLLMSVALCVIALILLVSVWFR